MEMLSIEKVLKQDRALVIWGLVFLTVLSWVYMFYLAWAMENTDMASMEMGMGMEMAMPQMQVWGPVDLLMTFIMWAVMMVAMMVPSAAPMILLFATINRKKREQDNPYVPTSLFLSGYLAIWTIFSLVATLAQWGLHSAALITPMGVSSSPIFGGLLLIGAGVFQFTPAKNACLAHCRSPLDFLMSDWREGARGAWMMGLRHGFFCVGCCWILMALLFVAGVMNLLWVAAIALFVLLEKVIPRGDIVGRVAGTILIVAGIFTLVRM